MDPETEPFTDYCDWAVANVRERLRGNDADAIVRLRGDIQTAAKGGANARRDGCWQEVPPKLPGTFQISTRSSSGRSRRWNARSFSAFGVDTEFPDVAAGCSISFQQHACQL